MDMKCPPRGDIREFLDELRTKREELDQVGIVINDNDHRSTIIASLPSTLASFASATLSAAQLFTTTKTVEPDTLIMLLKEAERERSVYAQKAGRVKENEEVLLVAPKEKKDQSSGRGRILSNAGWREMHRSRADGVEVGSHPTNEKGVQEHWPDSEKVAVERSICGNQTGSSVSRFEGESEGELGETETDKPVIVEPLSRKPCPAHSALTPMPPDPPAATPDVEPMSDAETIPEALEKRQQKPLPNADAVNNDRWTLGRRCEGSQDKRGGGIGTSKSCWGRIGT